MKQATRALEARLYEDPFYSNDDLGNRQDAMTQFADIIRYVGARIHHLTIDTGSTDGTILKPSSHDLVNNILATCPSLNKLSIKQTRVIDCSENGPVHQALTTFHLSDSSQFEEGFLSRLSARTPNFQGVKLEVDRRKILSSSGEFYDIVMPFTNFSTLTISVSPLDFGGESDNDTLGKDEDESETYN